jgi:phosphoribosylformylglycinamidine synthase
LGIEANLQGLIISKDCTADHCKLFSESNSRYVVEVEPEKFDSFAKHMLGIKFGQLGKVTDARKLVIRAENGNELINADIDVLKDAWKKPLDW